MGEIIEYVTLPELTQRDEDVRHQSNQVEARLDGLQSGNKHISSLDKWIHEFSVQLTSNERKLGLALKGIDKSIEQQKEEFNCTEEKLGLARIELEKCREDLSVKTMQLELVEESLQVRCEEFEVKEKEIENLKCLATSCNFEIGLKQKGLALLKSSISDCNSELELKQKELTVKTNQLSTVEKSIEEHIGQLESVLQELEMIEKEVEKVKSPATKCNEELELKQKGLISDSDSEIELKQKQEQLEMLQGLANVTSTEQLSGIETSVEKCQNELNLKMKEFDANERIMEERLEELDLNPKQLTEVQEKIAASPNTFSSKENHVDSIKALIDDNTEVLANKKQYGTSDCSQVLKLKLKYEGEINNAIKHSSTELKRKQTEVELIEKSISQHSSEVRLKKEELASVKKRKKRLTEKLRSKEEDFHSLKETLRTYCQDIELKARKFNVIRESIRERNEELVLKEELLKSIQISITEKSEQLEAMKNLDLVKIENSITECSEKLESKNKNLDLVRRALKECSKELDSKKKNLEFVKKSLKECCNDLTSKQAEFDSMQRKVCGLRKELKEREKHFDALKTNLEERSIKLEMKEKHYEARLKEFELKEHQTEATSQNRQAPQPFDVLTDDNDVLPNEILAALNSSADPAMFVLCVMQHSRVKTKVLLMEKMIEISPRISPIVKAEAVNQAVSWEANLILGSEKLTEVWAFLLFLAAYRLMHHFGVEEILKLVLVVASIRNAPDLCRLLDFTDKIPEIIEILIERKQHIDAARFTIAFGLLHIFPLQVILQNCFEHIKGKAIDEELSVLKAILQCLSDYKVNSIIDKESTLHRILELENERAFLSRGMPLTHASFNTQQQHLRNQNYRDELLFGGNSKRAKTGISYLRY